MSSARPSRSRAAWPPSLSEARAHAVILAAVLWIVAAGLLSVRGPTDRLGQLKGNDFAFFYTLGHLVLSGETDRIYDMDAEHEVRARLVPASAPDAFPSTYPPQVAVLFASIAWLRYLPALAVWTSATTVVYFGAVAAAYRKWSPPLSDRHVVFAAAAGFPPLWHLILNGQTTAIPIAAMTIGWLSLERKHRFVAGLAFGLLAMKPQLGIGLVAVTLWHREWRMILGGAVSVAVQISGVWLVAGGELVSRYAAVVPRLGNLRELLEPNPVQVHSLQSLTDLLPAIVGLPVWIGLAAYSLSQAIRIWGRDVPISVRVSAVILASVLVSPHLLIYDVALLAVPLICCFGWVVRQHQDHVGEFAAVVYVLFGSLLVPTALLIGLQASVLAILFLLQRVSRWAAAEASVGHSPGSAVG